MSLLQLCEAVKDMEVVEVGQYLEEGMPAHPSHSRFYKMRWHGFCLGDSCNDFQLILNEHNGTHVDSFGHYIDKPGFEMIDAVPLEKLWGPCVTVDATFLKDGETLEKEHLLAWEKVHGEIRPGDGVLIDFGWMQYWDVRPNDQRFCHDYPGVGHLPLRIWWKKACGWWVWTRSPWIRTGRSRTLPTTRCSPTRSRWWRTCGIWDCCMKNADILWRCRC